MPPAPDSSLKRQMFHPGFKPFRGSFLDFFFPFDFLWWTPLAGLYTRAPLVEVDVASALFNSPRRFFFSLRSTRRFELRDSPPPTFYALALFGIPPSLRCKTGGLEIFFICKTQGLPCPSVPPQAHSSDFGNVCSLFVRNHPPCSFPLTPPC